uniref:Uncharacterized protein n=1 Tax=Anopheles gambiae TaxID=7165 RepID=A0A2Y9D282_ANOGA
MEWICRLFSWQIVYYLFFPTHVICLLETVSSESNLTPTIDAIVRLPRHRFLPNFSAEVCIVTTNVSTLSQTHPELIRLLNSQHPVQFATEQPIKTAIRPRYANVVLLDVTGWEQFPTDLLRKQFDDNPCHFINARFIVLVTRSCFFDDRSSAVKFFDDQGIVNYAIVPTPMNASDLDHDTFLFTQNRYSKEEIAVRLDELDHLYQLYPDKLANMHAFYIRFATDRNNYPYIIELLEKGRFDGIILWLLFHIFYNILNLRITMHLIEPSDDFDADVYFEMSVQRDHFQHEFYFHQMGGMCVSCPLKTDRYFLPHIFKPFSFGTCVCLALVFVVCVVLKRFFPNMFRYELILQALFRGGGTEHYQPFPARIIHTSLSFIMLFLCRRYISNMISLMSLRMFYKLPSTIAEFKASGYKFLVYEDHQQNLPLDDFRFMMLGEDELEDGRAQYGALVHKHYCMMQQCSDAAFLLSPYFHENLKQFYTIQEPIIPSPYRLQFAKNSPLAGTISRYIGLYYETGLWQYLLTRHYAMQLRKAQSADALAEVVFYFDDFKIVWLMVVYGWLISVAVLIMEMLSKKMK